MRKFKEQKTYATLFIVVVLNMTKFDLQKES